ncbi:MAG TPA: patatin-like phospholipase family protein, partial [Candidatus Atribacteria bacterium]|nr:patatin-like phospholipase family protein [Candidatus Atribacteria bacterium]
MRFGLALSGGALRGVAHIGVLKALSENGLYPSYISGTSAGSMVAALYACGYSAVEMEKIALNLDNGIYDPDYPGMLRGIVQWILHRDFDWDGFLKGNEV